MLFARVFTLFIALMFENFELCFFHDFFFKAKIAYHRAKTIQNILTKENGTITNKK